MNKREKITEEQLIKKIDFASKIENASRMAVNFGGGLCVVSGVLGMVFGTAADAKLDNIAENLYETQKYQDCVDERLKSLVDDFANGNISYSEYKKSCMELLSEEGTFDYPKTAEGDKMASDIKEYQEYRKISDFSLNEAFPIVASATAGNGIIWGVAEEQRRKK